MRTIAEGMKCIRPPSLTRKTEYDDDDDDEKPDNRSNKESKTPITVVGPRI